MAETTTDRFTGRTWAQDGMVSTLADARAYCWAWLDACGQGSPRFCWIMAQAAENHEYLAIANGMSADKRREHALIAKLFRAMAQV